MNHVDQNQARIETEWHAVSALANESRIWSVSKKDTGQSQPEEWQLEFEGKFIAEVKGVSNWQSRSESSAASKKVEVILGEGWKASIQFPKSYPDTAPQILIESKVYHPNIAADGIVNLMDIGIVWNHEITMDLIIERLWNVVRGSHVDLANPINVGAGQWYRHQADIELPLDSRPLSGDAPSNRNIVQYRRKGRKYRGKASNRSKRSRNSNESIESDGRHFILDSDDSLSATEKAAGNDAIHFID